MLRESCGKNSCSTSLVEAGGVLFPESLTMTSSGAFAQGVLFGESMQQDLHISSDDVLVAGEVLVHDGN